MAKKAARAAKAAAKPARSAARTSTPARKAAPKKAVARKAAAPKKAAGRAAAAARGDKYVYSWGAGKADGNGSMKPLLGGKGANLAEMARIGLPVPPGFTLTTEVCTYYYANKRTYPAALDAQLQQGVAKIEKVMGYKFGDAKKFPLLVAVRSFTSALKRSMIAFRSAAVSLLSSSSPLP